MRASAAVLLCLAAAGCSARAGGPFPHAAPPSRFEPPPAADAPPGPSPTPTAGGLAALSHAPFFRGIEHLALHMPSVAARAGQDPRAAGRGPGWSVVDVPPLVRETAQRFARAGRRTPRILLAMGFSARLSKPPRACAEALLDPAVLGRTLDADESTAAPAPGASPSGVPRAFRLALLDRGKGPFRFDFRWSFRADRRDLPGGAILLRYELLSRPTPERVSAFEGVVVLEPDGGGTRLVEVLVLGSDVSVPFFLVGPAGKGVAKILTIRAERLANLLR